jgi:predicted peptidase
MARLRRPLPVLALLMAAGVLVGVAGHEGRETWFQERVYRSPDGGAFRYALFVPRDYSPERPVPVILFLHGGGEAGTDGRKPTEVGLGPAVRARAATFPFLVVFPQAGDRVPATFASWLPDQPDGVRALAILDEVCRGYRTDPARVYLTGISVGGFGAWQIAARHPERWAAVVPVCGLGPKKVAAELRSVPCWCFHGADDGVVPAQSSRDMIEAVRQAGGSPRYTEYPGVGHNAWERAYDTDELYEWLLRYKRR